MEGRADIKRRAYDDGVLAQVVSRPPIAPRPLSVSSRPRARQPDVEPGRTLAKAPDRASDTMPLQNTLVD